MIEAFARIMVKRPRIRDGSFKAYLYKTGRNLAYRHYTKSHKATEFSFEEYGFDIEGGEQPEKLLISKERRKVLHLCLERIDPQLREALWLVYFEDMSYKEADAVMGKTVHAAQALTGRARAALKKELEKEGITHEDL